MIKSERGVWLVVGYWVILLSMLYWVAVKVGLAAKDAGIDAPENIMALMGVAGSLFGIVMAHGARKILMRQLDAFDAWPAPVFGGQREAWVRIPEKCTGKAWEYTTIAYWCACGLLVWW